MSQVQCVISNPPDRKSDAKAPDTAVAHVVRASGESPAPGTRENYKSAVTAPSTAESAARLIRPYSHLVCAGYLASGKCRAARRAWR